MASVNKVILIGNLGRDPEVRYTPSGTAVANFTLATTDNWTDPDGQKQSRTEWHRIEAWGRLGEICGEYLSKGRQVYIEGSIRTDEWEDQEGNRRRTTKIRAWQMQMLGPRGAAEPDAARVTDEPPAGEDSGPEARISHSGEEPAEDDIPF